MTIRLPLGWTLHVYETVTSTMDVARCHLYNKSVILADCQTQGRGRHRRKWISKSGNLFCSLVICPQQPLKNWPELTFLTALATGETINSFLPNDNFLKYKWPNDILLKDQKVSGNLLEVHENFMIIGIGINLISCPEEGNYPPTCLANFSPLVPSPQEIVSVLVEKFQHLWHLWQHQGFAEIRMRWLRRAAFKDQKINLKYSRSGHATDIQGIFQEIDFQGNLVLKLADGTLKNYNAGDVSIALKENSD